MKGKFQNVVVAELPLTKQALQEEINATGKMNGEIFTTSKHKSGKKSY